MVGLLLIGDGGDVRGVLEHHVKPDQLTIIGILIRQTHFLPTNLETFVIIF